MTLPATLTLEAVAGRTWDAVVVGAGPAGSVAARGLARGGRSVLLVDKATFPRWKVCGCCLNGAALGALASIGLDDLPGRLGAVPITRLELAAGGRWAGVGLPSGLALSREAFDAALIREAVAAGAEFLPEVRVVRSRSERTTLTLTREPASTSVRSEILIAADGLNGHLTAEGTPSIVAEGSRMGAGVVADIAPDYFRPGSIYMAVGKGGYVGLVRLEDGRLDLAAAFDPGYVRSAGGLGPAAAATLSEAGFPPVPCDLPWRGTPALTRSPRRLAGDRWFAVGDAAGYVEPFTGEGMAWAIAAGAAVAPLAARPWEPGLVAEWEATHRRVVASRQDLCRTAMRVLRSPLLSRLAVRALAVAPWLARPVVAALNRPSPAPEPVA